MLLRSMETFGRHLMAGETFPPAKHLILLVRLAGLEPATYGLEVQATPFLPIYTNLYRIPLCITFAQLPTTPCSTNSYRIPQKNILFRHLYGHLRYENPYHFHSQVYFLTILTIKSISIRAPSVPSSTSSPLTTAASASS